MRLLILLVAVWNFYICAANESLNCKQLYEKGVEAYLDADYEKCVDSLEDAIHLYKTYMKKIQLCRLKCHDQVAEDEPLYQSNIDNLMFFEKTIRNTLCIIKCKDNDADIFNEFGLGDQDLEPFVDKKPYEYLHICYSQTKQHQKAASAAFTYWVYHPNDDAARRSLDHYASLPEVNKADVINYEADDYVYFFIHGLQGYEEKKWDYVIQNMEESLLAYLQAEDECRANCEGPFNQGWYPDFIPAIANHFTHVLRCKQKCKKDLSVLNGETRDDLFASHYHYLQYAYFKSGKLSEASSAATSYQLFFPADETMIHNVEYYKKMPKSQLADFIPRKEAEYYHNRDAYEQKILKFISENFTADTVNNKVATSTTQQF